MLCLLVTAPLALFAPQGQVPASPVVVPDVDYEYHLVPWPSGPEWENGQPFGRCANGDLTTVMGGDAAILRGSELYLLQGFQFMEALYPFEDLISLNLGAVADVAVSEMGGSNGLDSLYTVDTREGLVHLWATGQGAFGHEVIDGAVWWRRATRIITADLNGDGRVRDLVGIKGNEVRTYTRNLDLFVPGPAFTFASNLRDVAIGDYDADGEPDVVGMGDTIEVFPYGGGPGFVPIAIHADAMTTIPRYGNTTGDHLALAYRINGSATFEVRDASGVKQSLPLRIAPEEDMVAVDLETVAMRTGDWAGIGIDAVLLAVTNFPMTIALLRDGETGEFSITEDSIDRIRFEKDPDITPVPENRATPDFWTEDVYDRKVIVYPADSEDAIAITTSPMAIEVDTGATYGGGSVILPCRYDDSNKTLVVKFSLPGVIEFQDVTHVQVTYYRQTTEGSYVEGSGQHIWFPMGAEDANNKYLLSLLLDGSPLAPPYQDDWLDQGPLFWVMLSFIQGDYPTQTIHWSTAASAFGWRLQPLDDQGLPYDYYFLDLPWLIKLRAMIEIDPPLPGNNGNNPFGAQAVTTRLPAFSPVDPPSLPAPAIGDAVVPATGNS